MKLLLVVLAACSPAYSKTAASTFASANSCPEDRQTITREAPPAEIAADPERAKIWRDKNHLYSVSGCGKTAELACYVTGGDAMNPWVDCMNAAFWRITSN